MNPSGLPKRPSLALLLFVPVDVCGAPCELLHADVNEVVSDEAERQRRDGDERQEGEAAADRARLALL